MISTFDFVKLETLLRDFYALTRMRITVFDAQYHEILSYPEEIAPICRFIRSSSAADRACHQCDLTACKTAARTKKTYVYQCHAGLTEAVSPVFLGNIPVAYLLFGHLLSDRTHEEGWSAIQNACRPYHLDESAFHRLLIELPLTSEEKILSASHILQAVASYLCIDRMIMLREQDLPARIDDYIQHNYTKDIDTASLCRTFHIGKTTLYEIARQNYGMGIAEHIRSLRIEYAKRCLEEKPEMTIGEIAEQAGFSDYNYFITVFRKYVHKTPRQYRTQESGCLDKNTPHKNTENAQISKTAKRHVAFHMAI